MALVVFTATKTTSIRKSQTLPTPKQRPHHQQLLVCSSSYTNPQLADNNQHCANSMQNARFQFQNAANSKQNGRFQLQNATNSKQQKVPAPKCCKKTSKMNGSRSKMLQIACQMEDSSSKMLRIARKTGTARNPKIIP